MISDQETSIWSNQSWASRLSRSPSIILYNNRTQFTDSVPGAGHCSNTLLFQQQHGLICPVCMIQFLLLQKHRDLILPKFIQTYKSSIFLISSKKKNFFLKLVYLVVWCIFFILYKGKPALFSFCLVPSCEKYCTQDREF